MFLTKTWSALLALLATACLAGMYLLSLGNAGGFSDADRAAIRAVTEAGLASLEAQIQSSPVQRAPALLSDGRLKAAFADPQRGAGGEIDIDKPTLQMVLADVAEENLLGDHPQMTVGISDKAASRVASSGISEQLIGEVIASPTFKVVPDDEESVFAATLGGNVHVVKVSRAIESGHRLVAIMGLDTGAGSLLRRVLGSKNPAGLVRQGKLLGKLIGDQPVTSELEQIASENADKTPDDGASEVFTVGQGLNARIGSIGRVPGPAGKGPSGAMLVVLSRNTAAAGQQDLAEALRSAVDAGLVRRLPIGLLVGLLVVSIGLAMYLPNLEALGSMRRLAAEFTGVAQGSQHQIFHDRYSGVPGELARAAAAAQDALRNAYLAELDADGDELLEEPKEAPGQPARQRPQRSQRSDGRVQAIELPADDVGAAVDTSHEIPTDHTPQPSEAPAQDEAPLLTDDVATSDVAAQLAATLDGDEPAAPAPPPPAAAPTLTDDVRAAPPSPPAGTDQRESYFREIYDEFVQTKMACGESTEGFTFEKFARKLRRNTDDLIKRPGVSDVKFTVYVKDGKAALKAKVVKD